MQNVCYDGTAGIYNAETWTVCSCLVLLGCHKIMVSKYWKALRENTLNVIGLFQLLDLQGTEISFIKYGKEGVCLPSPPYHVGR